MHYNSFLLIWKVGIPIPASKMDVLFMCGIERPSFVHAVDKIQFLVENSLQSFHINFITFQVISLENAEMSIFHLKIEKPFLKPRHIQCLFSHF